MKVLNIYFFYVCEFCLVFLLFFFDLFSPERVKSKNLKQQQRNAKTYLENKAHTYKINVNPSNLAQKTNHLSKKENAFPTTTG